MKKSKEKGRGNREENSKNLYALKQTEEYLGRGRRKRDERGWWK